MSGGLEVQTDANCTNELSTSAQGSPNRIPTLSQRSPNTTPTEVSSAAMVPTRHDDRLQR